MYDQIISDLEDLKIRGAENVLKWGVFAFSMKIKDVESKCSFISTFLKVLNDSKKEILALRPNQIALNNALDYIFIKKRYSGFSSLSEIKEDVSERLNTIEDRLKYLNFKISQIGSKKIKSNMQVYTHGHSSFVENIFEDTLKTINFSVLYSDSKDLVPSFVKILSKNLPTLVYPFNMVDSIISNSDLILLGSSAVNKDGFLCEVGTSAIVNLAQVHGVPVYVVSDLLKYSADYKFKLSVDINVGVKLPSKVKYLSNDFDLVDADLFDGIICEEGIISWIEFKHLAKNNFN